MSTTYASGTTKQRRVYESVRRRIELGEFQPGERIPSDSDLVREFGVSRPTVAKALQELERAGFVRRRAGSGTFVLQMSGNGKHFGLLIPGLGDTEIFEPMCGEMARVAQQSGHSLLWGAASSAAPRRKDDDAASITWDLCQTFIQQGVAGVFFAPIELMDDMDQINHRVIKAFEEAQIPVVLLDRDYVRYPERSNHDLIGIDNRRVGFTITAHLIERGCRNIHFVSRPSSASTIDARIAGYIEAIVAHERVSYSESRIHRCDPKNRDYLRNIFDTDRPDGIICGNDVTAGHLMRSLEDLGIAVPGDVLVAGIDDVKYAELLRVRLTTVHQPCTAIGDAAFRAMLDRIEHPDAPAREVLLSCQLIVRDSTLRQSKA